jgi:hypothetical protein
MRDPVITEDGQCYERQAMEIWFATRRAKDLPLTSPATNNVIGPTLIPNHIVRGLIEEYCEERGIRLRDGEVEDACAAFSANAGAV